jgi:hypothetical protein
MDSRHRAEHKSHGKLVSLCSQPYISPINNDTVEFSSKKEILLAQQKAVNAHERYQQATRQQFKKQRRSK